MGKRLHFLILIIFCIFLSGAANGQQVGNCKPGTAKIRLEGEDFSCLLLNQADMFWDPGASLGGYSWPKSVSGTQKNLSFASAIWFGGKDLATNELVVSAQTYHNSWFRTFWPGPVNAANNQLPIPTSSAVCELWDRVFTVRKGEVDTFMVTVENSLGPVPESLIPDNIKYWPGRGNVFLQAQFGSLAASMDQDLAPFIDVNGDGVYNPTDGDSPDIGKRKAMAWWVLNDVGNTKNFDSNEIISPGRNLEFQFTASVYPSRPDGYFLRNSLFVDVKLINKGSSTLDTCYFGLWSDSDVGWANDDFIQCHVMKNLGFTYNADSMDESPVGYGEKPPVFGFKVLNGPVVYPNDGVDNNRDAIMDEVDEKSYMSGFSSYVFLQEAMTGEPKKVTAYFNWLRSRFLDGTPMSYDGKMGYGPTSPNFPICQFIYPGTSDPQGFGVGGSFQNPIIMPEWTELSAGQTITDHRFLMSAGPFQLSPGETEHYSFVTLVGFGGSSNLDNINQLYAVSDSLDLVLPILNERKAVEPGANTESVVYPNPATGEITISWSKMGSSPQYLDILDSRGTVLKRVKLQNALVPKARISLNGLPTGLYQVTIHHADGNVRTRRFLKE